VPCTADAFAGHDAALLSTGHRQFRDPSLYARVPLIIDTRNVVKLPEGAKTRLVRA
jgi:UDP-N-acetyl-D-mannosaminuronate dehydrogenase